MLTSGCLAAAVVGGVVGGAATVGGVAAWPDDCSGEGCVYSKALAGLLFFVGIPLLLISGGYLISNRDDL